MNIDKRVALVTGAASGIGRAIAERLALDGKFHICVVDIHEDAAREAAQAIKSMGGSAQAYAVDLSDATQLKAMCREVTQAVGAVDVLVNNAGLGGVFPVETYPEESWNQIMAVNLTAAFLLSKHFLPAMRAKGWGRIVNISSINGLRAGSGRLAYGTSKTAIIGLTRQLAIDTAQWGITVNAIAPGTIETPMLRQMVSKGRGTQEALMRLVPMNRFGLPSEIAGVAAFLTSDDAAYLTGHTIPVDGGFSAAGIFVRDLFENVGDEK